ncbi:hypothetical protein ACN28S_17230 [Cystobacter fuscus]
MRPDFLRVLLLSSACVLSACPAPSPSQPAPGTPPADAGTGSSDEVTPSSRDNLRIMNPEQLTAHFAAALSLPPEQVCNELGKYACTTNVHNVVLNGVDPYVVGLFEPLKTTGATTPNVIDRVALAACARRVSLDVSTPGRRSSSRASNSIRRGARRTGRARRSATPSPRSTSAPCCETPRRPRWALCLDWPPRSRPRAARHRAATG